MSNTESISAKLRRWADESESDNRRHFYPTFNASDDFGIKIPDDDIVSERELFRRIAAEVDAELESTRDSMRYKSLIPLDQVVGEIANGSDEYDELKAAIDRYYLPRPLFEDGEPAQFGDTFVTDSGYNATLSSLNYTKGDHDYVSANGGKRHKVTDRLKRPEPQVLDADGVPIEVGDVVWILKDSKHAKWTVIEPYDGIQTVYVESRGIRVHARPENITHSEPDTQERIDEDATIAPRWYCEKHSIELSSGADFAETYIKMTEHLLRRQRELDGRDA